MGAQSAAAPVPVARLRTFVSDVLEGAGMAAADALEVADGLLWADLRSVHTHGVSRLPQYIGWIESGELNARASLSLVVDQPALALLEGDRCAGAVGMRRATDEAIARAGATGCASVLLRATTHTGAIGRCTERIAREGLIGIAGSVAVPLMAYHGAARAALSTAPLSIAAPGAAGAEPVVFDMAASRVSNGRLKQARRAGETLPPDWALDAQGRPTTDSALASILLPVGGAKGSGLALMMEMVASLATGHPILVPALAASGEGRRFPHVQNAFVIAIDARRLAPQATREAATAHLVEAIHALPSVDSDPVLLPGERGQRRRREQAATGIALPPGVRRDLEAFAASRGVDVPW